MTRKSKVRRNQRSKRVQRNRNRNTKRLTKRGRTNVRKNSKKINSKRRKRRKTRKTRQNVIMKGGLWPSTKSTTLLQPEDQEPVYYDLFASEGAAPIPRHDVREQSYPGRTGETPGFKLANPFVQIPDVGRLEIGTHVFYSTDDAYYKAATIVPIPEAQYKQMSSLHRAGVALNITGRLPPKNILARRREVTAENTEFTTTVGGDPYLAFLPPDRPEVPLYLKVLDLISREEIWIYFLSKWVKSRPKLYKDKGYRRRMFLLRPVFPQELEWSGCGSTTGAAALENRAWPKYVDRKIKGIHWDLDDENKTVTVSYEDRERGPVNDVFRLLPQRKVKISGYQETDKPVSDILSQQRKSGPEEFEENEDQDWGTFKGNLEALWTEYMSADAVTDADIGPKGVNPSSGTPAGTRAYPVVGKALKTVLASPVTAGVIAGSPGTVMAEAVPPDKYGDTGGATGL
jgi:hypothetical protein